MNSLNSLLVKNKMVCQKRSILIHIIVLQVKLIFHSNINELTKFLLLYLENLKFILVPKVLKTPYLLDFVAIFEYELTN